MYLRARSTNDISTAVESACCNVNRISFSDSLWPPMGWIFVPDVVGDFIAFHPKCEETKKISLLARNILPLSLEVDVSICTKDVQLHMLNTARDDIVLCVREPQREVVDNVSVCEVGLQHGADGTEFVDGPLFFADHCCGCGG